MTYLPRLSVTAMLLCVALTVSPAFGEPPMPQGQSASAKKPGSPPPPLPATSIAREVVNSVVGERVDSIMTPADVSKVRTPANEYRQATLTPYDGPVPKPVVRSIEIDPTGLSSPNIVRLWQGAISAIVFSDTNGNPWYVTSASFDKRFFSDGSDPAKQADKLQGATNMLKLAPTAPYAYGNIVVELEGLPTALIFMLSTGNTDENDVRLDVRVKARNPGARPAIVEIDGVPEHDQSIASFVDGIPPEGAQRLRVTGGEAEAWNYKGALYLRTRLSVLSPAFRDHQANTMGMRVYKFPKQLSNVMVSLAGKATTLFLEGY